MAYNFSEVGKYVKVANTVITDGYFSEDYLSQMGRVYKNIVNGDKISRTNSQGWKGSKANSCNREYNDANLLSDATWSVAEMFIGDKLCYADIEGEFKRSNPVGSVKGNDPLEQLLVNYTTDGFNQSVLALSLFGTSGSTTPGLSLIDGIFTQALTDAATNTDRLTAFGTQTAQYAKTNTNAVDAVLNMMDEAPAKLKASKDKVLIMSDALWSAIQFNVRVAGGQVVTDSAYKELFGGLNYNTFNNVPVISSAIFDAIVSDMVSGQDAMEGKKYFALYTSVDALAFGTTGDEEGVAKINFIDDLKEGAVYTNVVAGIGAALANPEKYQLLA